MTQIVGRLVHYAGSVQGVGFRLTAQALSRKFAVAGWVRNLADGRVALLAEGSLDQIESFLSAIRRRFGGYIHQEESQDQPPTGQFNSFQIAR